MNVIEYITELREKNGILITVADDGRLDVRTKTHGNLTPEILEDIKSHKQEILDIHKRHKVAPNRFMGLAPKEEHYPLSYAQRRMWVLDQLVEQDGLYNVPLWPRFQDIDFELIQQAFRILIERHEILRTVIRLVSGEPRQFILPMSQIDLSIDRKQVTESQLNVCLLEEVRTRLDLSVLPWKAKFFELCDGGAVFSWVMHHIVTDSWSLKVLIRDFNEIYEALIRKAPPTLNPLSFQYKDYTVWQKERINNGSLLNSKLYWHKLFEGFEAAVDLPRDKPRGTEKHIGGSQIIMNLPPEASASLVALANEMNASFFMVCTSLIYTLVYRYTGARDITLGTPITGRDHSELEDQVGYYSNTVVLRSELDPEQSFRELLKKVFFLVLEAMDHQFYPFDLLVEELDIEKDKSRNPLFDIIMSYHDIDEEHDVSQETDETTLLEDGFNKFELAFDFTKTHDNYLKVLINYDNHLFSDARMLRMSDHLKELISAVSTNPDLNLHQLRYYTGEEEQQLIAVNQKDWKVDEKRGIKELFENQVRVTPNEVALLSKEKNMTFSKLNEHANLLGNYLINRCGVQIGDKVAVWLEKGFQQVISLLAVIKIGATYVPLDLDQPEVRLKFIMNDTQSKLIISEKSHVRYLSELGGSVVALDEIAKELEQQPSSNPKVDADHDYLAILYTSGTTGIPKGVILTEKGIVNRMKWLWQSMSFGSEDVIYQKTSFLFDVSIGEIFMPLCFGARLLVESSKTSREILENVKAFNVTYIHFSCTQLNHFLNSTAKQEDQQLASLRNVFSSGEAVQRETVNHFYQRFEIPLINLYGPTEASIEVSYFETKAGEGTVPIGQPIANVQLYVLDEHYQMTGVGIPGEIYISGICLAHAYLNRQDLTEERFLPNPFGQPGDKMFRTGDFGYWNESMQLEFLGRKDRQVSINGSRIELDGIVSQILMHDEVQEATITVEKDLHGNYHLHAFYARKFELEKKPELDTIEISSNGLKPGAEIEAGEQIDYQITKRLEQYVLEAAQSYQSKVAVRFKDSTLTYGDLCDLSGKLANQLINCHDIKEGAVVALAMKRSEKAIVSMLAILRAGAVYLPIDPDYPSARINHMLCDARAKVVISDRETENVISTDHQKMLVYEQLIEAQSELKLEEISYDPDALCYLCYTSGSTGQPKGVKISHASVIDYVHTFIRYFDISMDDKVLQQSSLSFDTSIEEIYPALIRGATIVIQPDGGQDIDGIIHSVNSQLISVLSVTPMILHQLNLRCSQFTHYPKSIISGGDLLRPSDVDQLIEYTAIYNTYGPTETTICVAFGKVDKVSEAGIIGRPIPNHKLYLLDKEMKPVDVWETGEVYIAGTGVAQGYMNNEQEMHLKFVDNPFEGGTMYKSGDLAKWTDEGRLVFQGREDNQVKVRGYRIELLEIDHHLIGFRDIKDVATIVKSGPDGINKIIAYYTADTELPHQHLRTYLEKALPFYMIPTFFVHLDEFPRTLNHKLDIQKLPLPATFIIDHEFSASLRRFLRQRFPAYMIPTHFIPLEKIPITITGKINTKALKEISAKLQSASMMVITPKNESERTVLEVWRTCLKQPEISVEANFFELGGDSIKAMQIVAQLTKVLKVDVVLKDIINYPTIAGLVEHLRESNGKDKSLKVSLNQHAPGLSTCYFIPPITGSATIFRAVAKRLEGNLNCVGLQYPSFESAESSEKSVAHLARTLSQEIDSKGDYLIVGYSMGAAVAFEMAKLLKSKIAKSGLVLIDRGPYSKASDLSKEAMEKVIDSELRRGLNVMGEELLAKTKRAITKNNEMLCQYNPAGKVPGPVLAIEAVRKKVPTNMEAWKNFVDGEFHCELVQTHHYGIISDDFESQFADLLEQFVNHKATIQR